MELSRYNSVIKASDFRNDIQPKLLQSFKSHLADRYDRALGWEVHDMNRCLSAENASAFLY